MSLLDINYGGSVVLGNMNLNHLYYFYIIAREGSLANATNVLNVSQPTLSQQLKILEQELGQTLFSRDQRSLKLNSHGEYIFDYCKEIFQNIEIMLTGFNYQLRLDTVNFFKIGLTPTLARTSARKLLSPLFLDNQVGVSTVEGNLDFLIGKLQSFELDFILADKVGEDLKLDGIEQIKIRDVKNIVVCGENFERSGVNSLPEDLHKRPYFKYSSTNTYQKIIDKIFYKKHVQPLVVGETDDIGLMISATEVNHCFSIVPDVAVESMLKRKKLFKLGTIDEGEDSSINGFFVKNERSPKINKTIQIIKENFSK